MNSEEGGSSFNFDDLVPGMDLDEALQDPPTPPAEGGTGRETPSGESDEELKASRRLNAQLLAQQERLQTQLDDIQRNQRAFNDNNQRPAAPPPDMEAVKQRLAADMLSDPGGTVLRIMEAAKQQAIAEVEARTAPLGAGTASLEVRNFMSEMQRADADFDEFRGDFEALVNQPGMAEGLSKLSADQRRTTLETLYDTAIGRTEKRRRTGSKGNQRENQPPMYGGGTTVGASGGGGAPGESTYKGKPLSPDQREVLRAAKDAGITDPKRIKAMLDTAGNA